jgi:hypothetical protein
MKTRHNDQPDSDDDYFKDVVHGQIISNDETLMTTTTTTTVCWDSPWHTTPAGSLMMKVASSWESKFSQT